jgi:hypothetical protein
MPGSTSVAGRAPNPSRVVRRRGGPIHPFQKDGLPALQHDLGGAPSPVLSASHIRSFLPARLRRSVGATPADCASLSALHNHPALVAVCVGGRAALVELMP